MFLIVHFLLCLGIGSFSCYTEEFKFVTKTVTAGQNVTLSCPHQTSRLYRETFYWIRLVSGNWPEFLGATFNLMDDDVSKIPHIQTMQDRGEFLLHINEAKRNDTGLYYCIKVKQLDFIFINGIFLKIKGPESDITQEISLIQKPQSGPIYSENPETLQCSVFYDSDMNTCPSDNTVFWFRTGSDRSHPSLLYVQGNGEDECERNPDAPSAKKCFYNFSETFDAGTYYCAVAACGQILFGNGAKMHYKATSVWSQQANISIGFSLAITLIILVVFIYAIKESNGNASAGLNAKKAIRQKWQANIYTAVIYAVMNADGGKKKTKRQRRSMRL